MAHIDFIQQVHTSAKRDYFFRGCGLADKPQWARVARRFGFEYWDGDRKYGYGGYRYDGRWRPVAQRMAEHYGLRAGDRVLDVGCGKGYLLYDFTQVVPGIQITGIDVSAYALEHAKEEVRPYLQPGNAVDLPYQDHSFDLVVSINVLHNLYNFQLRKALQEMQRVARKHMYLVVDAYRNEEEQINLMNWSLTCVCFYTPEEWEWLFRESGYTGDYSFIYYE